MNGAEKDLLLTKWVETKIMTDEHVCREAKDRLLCEHRVVLTVKWEVQNTETIRINCTASDIEELCAGVLLTRGYIRTAEEIVSMVIDREPCTTEAYESCVSITLRADWRLDREPMPVPAGGGFRFGKIRPEQVFGLAGQFRQYEGLHAQTAGTHLCMLAKEQEILFITEDISRHNAIDKAAGYALLHGIDREACMLFSSGRVQEDTVKKVVSSGIGVLVSKSVPTAQAVELAKKAGLCLICRAWKDEYRIYAAEQ